MKAIWNNKVIAEADKAKLIYIEGNWYFPPDAIKKEYSSPIDTVKKDFTNYVAFWHGVQVAE